MLYETKCAHLVVCLGRNMCSHSLSPIHLPGETVLLDPLLNFILQNLLSMLDITVLHRDNRSEQRKTGILRNPQWLGSVFEQR